MRRDPNGERDKRKRAEDDTEGVQLNKKRQMGKSVNQKDSWDLLCWKGEEQN